MMSTSVLLLTTLCFTGMQTESIEPMAYRSDAQLQKQWSPSTPSVPKVRLDNYDAKPAMRIEAPFSSQEKLWRVAIDRKVNLDLTVATQFSLRLAASNTDAPRSAMIYFKSGEGWYVSSLYHGLKSPRMRTFILKKEQFRSEGTPEGWKNISAIRIAFARPEKENADFQFYLGEITAQFSTTSILVPDDDKGEHKRALEIAKKMETMLTQSGVFVDRIKESELDLHVLKSRKMLILPHNQLTKQQYQTLKQFVQNGGKLFLNYRIPASLSTAIGIKQGKYVSSEAPHKFASFQFEPNRQFKIQGTPQSVTQHSWNITTGIPIGHNATSVARWYNEQNKPTDYSAMVMSDRAIYFSHVLLNEDPEAIQKMLLAVIGKLEPGIWLEAATFEEERLEQVGHFTSSKNLIETLQPRLSPTLQRELRQSIAITQKAKQLARKKEGYLSRVEWMRSRDLRVDIYLKSRTSPKREARAFWEHAGTGPYPGNWDKACKELKAAGFNIIITNMLNGGEAHYASDVLKRSETFQQYGDQIEQCLKAARKYGLEVHIWKVNHKIPRSYSKEEVEKLRKAGRLQVPYKAEDKSPWLNPAHPENFKLERDSMLEIARKYDVDGLHFDYIRYPSISYCFSDFSRKQFEKDTGVTVKNWPHDCAERKGVLFNQYRDWRANNITRTVKAVSTQARKIKPNILLSAAVFRDYPKCRINNAQDWVLWAKEGYLDFLCPMNYTTDDKQFKTWIESQTKLIDGKIPIYPGIGSWKLPPDRTVGQITITRKYKTGGFTVFNLDQKTAETVLPAIHLGAGKNLAIPPHQN